MASARAPTRPLPSSVGGASVAAGRPCRFRAASSRCPTGLRRDRRVLLSCSCCRFVSARLSVPPAAAGRVPTGSRRLFQGSSALQGLEFVQRIVQPPRPSRSQWPLDADPAVWPRMGPRTLRLPGPLLRECEKSCRHPSMPNGACWFLSVASSLREKCGARSKERCRDGDSGCRPSPCLDPRVNLQSGQSQRILLRFSGSLRTCPHRKPQSRIRPPAGASTPASPHRSRETPHQGRRRPTTRPPAGHRRTPLTAARRPLRDSARRGPPT